MRNRTNRTNIAAGTATEDTKLLVDAIDAMAHDILTALSDIADDVRAIRNAVEAEQES